MGRKNRFPYDELFDVSNQEDDGSLTQVDSKRDHTSRVSSLSVLLDPFLDLKVLSRWDVSTKDSTVSKKHAWEYSDDSS